MALLDTVVRLILSREASFRAGYRYADQLKTELGLECALVYVREEQRVVALVVLNDDKIGGRVVDIRKTLMRRVYIVTPDDGLPLLVIYQAF